MNKYIIPFIERKKIKLDTVSARSRQECEEKFMLRISEYLDVDPWDDWDTFKDDVKRFNITVDEIYDIEEL